MEVYFSMLIKLSSLGSHQLHPQWDQGLGENLSTARQVFNFKLEGTQMWSHSPSLVAKLLITKKVHSQAQYNAGRAYRLPDLS